MPFPRTQGRKGQEVWPLLAATLRPTFCRQRRGSLCWSLGANGLCPQGRVAQGAWGLLEARGLFQNAETAPAGGQSETDRAPTLRVPALTKNPNQTKALEGPLRCVEQLLHLEKKQSLVQSQIRKTASLRERFTYMNSKSESEEQLRDRSANWAAHRLHWLRSPFGKTH